MLMTLDPSKSVYLNCLLFISVLLFATAHFHQGCNGNGKSSSITYTTICKIGATPIEGLSQNRYAGIREPNSIITDDGTLVVVFGPHDKDAKNDRAHQDLLCTYSKDEGATWSTPQRIMDRGMESLLPTILVYDKINDT